MKASSSLEKLEIRMLLASDWQNVDLAEDVDRSGYVSAIDALVVINRLNHSDSGALPVREANSTEPYYDTNGDGRVSAIDALLVINLLNRGAPSPILNAVLANDSDPNGNAVVLGASVTLVGQTRPDWTVSLRASGVSTSTITAAADADGHFSIDVPLSIGPNDLDFSVRNALGYGITRRLSLVRGDVVLDWNATVLNVVREWSTTSDDPYEGRIVTAEPPRVARNLAMIHTAMFDAMNAVEQRYESYVPELLAPSRSSSTAAGVAAAYRVATQLYPATDEMAYWDATLFETLATVEDGPAKQDGIKFGTSVGDAMLALRANDGSDRTIDYEGSFDPGDWNRTTPGFLPPLLPHWPDVTPFAIDGPEDYRPEPPPELTSDQYAASVDEVMRLGGINSDTRTPDQTEIAVFWADGGGTFTPPGHWNQIAADVVASQNNSVLDNARTFSLLNLALADAGITTWDAKYHYDLWRPIDAIRRADDDGNSNTSGMPNWMPLLVSPPFPTYTSGHSTFSGAADAVLTALLGDNTAFTSQIDARSAPGQRPISPDLIVTRSFSSFTEAAEEAGLSRIYGGIHFDFDNTAGLEAGRSVGHFVVENMLRPLI